jgi:hypothetical protein
LSIKIWAKSVENLPGLGHRLLQGETLPNCEDWIEVTESDKESLRVTSEDAGIERVFKT